MGQGARLKMNYEGRRMKEDKVEIEVEEEKSMGLLGTEQRAESRDWVKMEIYRNKVVDSIQ